MKDNAKNTVNKKRISQIIESYLFRICLMVFLLYVVVVFISQVIYTREESLNLIEAYVKDFSKTTEKDFLKTQLKDYTATFRERLEDNMSHLKDSPDEELLNRWLQDIVTFNSEIVTEVNVFDSNGINIYSSAPENIGYDMHFGKQASEFLCLLNGTNYYEQDFRTISSDKTKVMKYAGMPLSNGKGFFQIGISEKRYNEWKDYFFAEEVRHRRVGLSGHMVILNSDFQCIGSTEDAFTGDTLHSTDILPKNEYEYKRSVVKIKGTPRFLVATLSDGYYILGGIPVSKTLQTIKAEIISTFFLITILLICIFIYLSKNLNASVVKSILTINYSLTKIIEGDLTEKVDVDSSIEFEELSNGINHTVERLNLMIEEADKRLDKELEAAHVIQSTSLPNVFPPFPNRKEISLFAIMDSAKKVGGDFYDYYMLSENRLAFVMADVSDKGIPAALFMMRAKAAIKALAVTGIEVNEVIAKTNEELIKNNEAGMFVTVWLGFLDLDTGLISYVHAGHTYPFVIRNGRAVKIKQKRDFIVGGMPGIKYTKQEFLLLPNDTIFLYTDGVTEAFDTSLEEYGDKRLEKALLSCDAENAGADSDEYCEKICNYVRNDVAAFSNDAPQSDDITLLCIKYNGKEYPEKV